MWNPNVYQKPGIYWEEVSSTGINPVLPQYPLTLIGNISADVSVTEIIALDSMGAELTYQIIDEDTIIVTDYFGRIVYEEGSDYVITPKTDMENTKVSIWSYGPTGLAASVSSSGGNLEAGKYSYLVTAVSKNGLETTSITTGNFVNEIEVTGSASSVLLTWSAVEGASYYRIYRGGTGETITLLKELDASYNSYTDDGTDTPNGVTTPSNYFKCLVTYSYTQEDRYDVHLWTDVDDLEAYYGAAIDSSTGLINCPLSFAARKAASNKCQYIQTVAVNGSSLQAWKNALEKLKQINNIDIIVPLCFNPNFFAECLNFISEMHDANVFPFFILGGEEGYSEDDLYNAIPSSGNENMVMVANPYVENYNPITNSTYNIAGYYAAAAIGGKLLSQQVYVPLTKKIINDIYAVPKMTERKMNYYANKGMLILANRGNVVECRHGLTTDMTNPATKEINVVRSKHYMLLALIEDLNNSVVGTALDEYTVVSTKAIVVSKLNYLKNSRIISDFMDVKTRLNAENPTRVDIKFKYRPSWPINYIVIQFSIDMTTGELTTTS